MAKWHFTVCTSWFTIINLNFFVDVGSRNWCTTMWYWRGNSRSHGIIRGWNKWENISRWNTSIVLMWSQICHQTLWSISRIFLLYPCLMYRTVAAVIVGVYLIFFNRRFWCVFFLSQSYKKFEWSFNWTIQSTWRKDCANCEGRRSNKNGGE
jgi:hypothetical protein